MLKETIRNIWIVWGIVYQGVADILFVPDSEHCFFVNFVLFVAL